MGHILIAMVTVEKSVLCADSDETVGHGAYDTTYPNKQAALQLMELTLCSHKNKGQLKSTWCSVGISWQPVM